jgi:hypothetical protein
LLLLHLMMFLLTAHCGMKEGDCESRRDDMMMMMMIIFAPRTHTHLLLLLFSDSTDLVSFSIFSLRDPARVHQHHHQLGRVFRDPSHRNKKKQL